jgi:hypothetical protein
LTAWKTAHISLLSVENNCRSNRAMERGNSL